MSAGPFVYSKYLASEVNGGGVYKIRIQPETLNLVIATVANNPPVGAIDQRVSASTSRSMRSYGFHAAMVYIKFDTAPEKYKQGSIIALPMLSTAIRAAAVGGATGTYLGETITVVGQRSEKAK